MNAHFILYVSDQERSTKFYSAVLDRKPDLHVPGMTEFRLAPECVLGLMPEHCIMRLLGVKLPDPANAAGVPRSEVYLVVDDPKACHLRAIETGAVELRGLEPRSWGHLAAYSLDPDGHVLAFAEVQSSARS